MADKFLNVEIVTPQTTVFNGKGTSVNLPGTVSPFEVLFNHAPIVSSLDAGVIRIQDETGLDHYFICGTGFTEVRTNNVAIMVESAEDYKSLSEDKISNEINKIKSLIETLEDENDKKFNLSEIKKLEFKLYLFRKVSEIR